MHTYVNGNRSVCIHSFCIVFLCVYFAHTHARVARKKVLSLFWRYQLLHSELHVRRSLFAAPSSCSASVLAPLAQFPLFAHMYERVGVGVRRVVVSAAALPASVCCRLSLRLDAMCVLCLLPTLLNGYVFEYFNGP